MRRCRWARAAREGGTTQVDRRLAPTTSSSGPWFRKLDNSLTKRVSAEQRSIIVPSNPEAAHVRDALREAVERTIDVVPDAGSSICQEILRFAARQAARSDSPELCAATTRLFHTITPKLIDLVGDKAAAGRCIEQILMAAVSVVQGSGVRAH